MRMHSLLDMVNEVFRLIQQILEEFVTCSELNVVELPAHSICIECVMDESPMMTPDGRRWQAS
jgi:hypothetical protein